MKPAGHLPGLDGLRGLSALIVAVGHGHIYGLAPFVDRGSGGYGVKGVLLFFVISGFLMGHLYLRTPFTRTTISHYAANRATRIVPLYFAVLLAGFVITLLQLPDWPYALSAGALARHLLFIGSVSVFWSIGPEVQYYAFFILLWSMMTLPERWRLLSLAALALLVGVCALAQNRLPGILFLSKLHIFIAGTALALVRPWIMQRLGHAAPLLQLLALLLFALLVLPPAPLRALTGASDALLAIRYDSPLWLTAVLVIVLGASVKSSAAELLLGNRLARLLGNGCFSIYLLHVPLLYAMSRTGMIAALPGAAGWLVAFVLIVLVSALSYHLLERPLRQRLRPVVATALINATGGRGA
jgi:peptidoglycan/LPS O-acetylase OafA/YrhL